MTKSGLIAPPGSLIGPPLVQSIEETDEYSSSEGAPNTPEANAPKPKDHCVRTRSPSRVELPLETRAEKPGDAGHSKLRVALSHKLTEGAHKITSSTTPAVFRMDGPSDEDKDESSEDDGSDNKGPANKPQAYRPDPKRQVEKYKANLKKSYSAASDSIEHREQLLLQREQAAEHAVLMELKSGEQRLEAQRVIDIANLDSQRLANHMKNEEDKRKIELLSLEDKRILIANAESHLRGEEKLMQDRLLNHESRIHADASDRVREAEANLESRVGDELKRQKNDIEEHARAQIRLTEDNCRMEAERREAQVAHDLQCQAEALAQSRASAHSEQSQKYVLHANQQALELSQLRAQLEASDRRVRQLASTIEQNAERDKARQAEEAERKQARRAEEAAREQSRLAGENNVKNMFQQLMLIASSSEDRFKNLEGRLLDATNRGDFATKVALTTTIPAGTVTSGGGPSGPPGPAGGGGPDGPPNGQTPEQPSGSGDAGRQAPPPPPPPQPPSNGGSSDSSSSGSDSENGDGEGETDLQKALAILAKAKKKKKSSVLKADAINLGRLPNVLKYKKWRGEVRQKVADACSKPDKAFKWITAVEDEDATQSLMANCDRKFVKLDAKLSDAINEMMKDCENDLAKQLLNIKEANVKAGRRTLGREMLWVIYRNYKVDEASLVLFSIEDLMKVEISGAKGEKLYAFITEWDSKMIHMKEPPDPNVVQALFVKQVRKCDKLKKWYDEYHIADAGDPRKTYDYLYQTAKKVLIAERKAFVRQSETGDTTHALASETMAKARARAKAKARARASGVAARAAPGARTAARHSTTSSHARRLCAGSSRLVRAKTAPTVHTRTTLLMLKASRAIPTVPVPPLGALAGASPALGRTPSTSARTMTALLILASMGMLA